jgi:alkanesulfonate monooxygenase SsuD/methylene tetrahydromethanopterin reductase-like flavin-dependent oxidoreductase (luciferase family)
VDIGLGLPTARARRNGAARSGSDREVILAWARAADRGGFSTLATTDRLVYPTYDGLTALAAAAAVTERCRLTTAVLVAPLYQNVALLAKQAATVDRISGGRLVLGLAVGSRRDDFAASGVPMIGRGERLEDQLAEIQRTWAGERRGFAGAVGPAPVRTEGPEIVLGGHAPAAIARAARLADGWIAGAGGPEMFRRGAAAFTAEWQRAGREGRPRLLALAYFAAGDAAEEAVADHVGDYYAFAPPYANQVARTAAVGESQIGEMVKTYENDGCDELILMPCSAEPEQVDLARAAAGLG